MDPPTNPVRFTMNGEHRTAIDRARRRSERLRIALVKVDRDHGDGTQQRLTIRTGSASQARPAAIGPHGAGADAF